ncbi:MAG TPA: carbonic anhydrase, partial [Spirochaetota bacterium]|nr:carbonic anhydrase [Spirochaetota bacterium]
LGVTVKDGHYVPAGTVLKSQKDADALPVITDDYAFKSLNKGVVHVNTHLADGYNKAGIK